MHLLQYTSFLQPANFSPLILALSRILRPVKIQKRSKSIFHIPIVNKELLQDTSGLTVGDPLVKTGLPLSLELGPGILDGIYVSWRATVATTS